MFLSIVIPAYNEEKRIAPTIDKILGFMKAKDYAFEVVVVDDGSTDGTVELVKSRFGQFGNVKVLANEANHGKGYVVRQGMLFGQGDILLYTDADLATPIEEIDKMLLQVTAGYDVVAGSRVIKSPEAKVRRGFLRFIIGRIFSLFVRMLTVRGLSDTQCGFKMFTKGAAREIFSRQKIDSFSFDVEILYLAKRLGFRIKEVPVSWFETKDTKVRFVRDSLMMARDLFRIRMIHRGKNEFSAKA